MARGAGGPDLVVDVQTRPDDRRIPDPPHDLEVVTDSAGNAGDITARIDGEDVDGAASLGLVLIDRRQVVITVTEILFPLEPVLARLFGHEIFFLEPVHLRKAQRTFADEEPVIRPLHDETRDRARRLDALERRYRADIVVIRAVHHRGVELQETVFVGIPPITHRRIPRIRLGEIRRFLGRVHRRAAIREDIPSNRGDLFANQRVRFASDDERTPRLRRRDARARRERRGEDSTKKISAINHLSDSSGNFY